MIKNALNYWNRIALFMDAVIPFLCLCLSIYLGYKGVQYIRDSSFDITGYILLGFSAIIALLLGIYNNTLITKDSNDAG